MLPYRYRGATLPCAFFFLVSGSVYAMMMSRMPALKAQAGMDDANVGLGLFCMGVGSMCALTACNILVRRVSTRVILRLASLLLFAAVILVGHVASSTAYCAVMAVVGVSLGLIDVCMNTQAILHERRRDAHYMGFFQACYSFGGIVGACAGFLAASLGVSPAWNFAAFCLLCLAGWLFSCPYLRADLRVAESRRRGWRLPSFIIFCGVMELSVFISEGCVVDWGSIYLHSVKGAPENVAAMSYGASCIAMFVARLFCDRLRDRFSDFTLIFCGALGVAAGLALALASPWPPLCLAGFAIMGLSGAPIFPIIMSRAGQYPGIEPSAACAAVSTLGYTGLLFFPPLLGFVSRWHGLTTALLIPLGFALLMCAGSFAFRTGSGTR